jgi:hypothetical protein
MKFSKVFCLSFLFAYSCGQQDTNSNSNDKPVEVEDSSDTKPSETDTPHDTLRKKALSIINTNCASCHSNFSSLKSDDQWTSSNYVIAGNASGSLLIKMLINSGGTMPKTGIPISNEDYQSLQDWINGIK